MSFRHLLPLMFSLSACALSHSLGSIEDDPRFDASVSDAEPNYPQQRRDAAIRDDASLGDASANDAGPLGCFPYSFTYEIGTTSQGRGVVIAVDNRTVSVTLEDGSLAAFRWFRDALPSAITIGTEVELSVDGPWSRLRIMHSAWSLVAYTARAQTSANHTRIVLPESMQTVSLVETCTAPQYYGDHCDFQRVFDAEVTQRDGRTARIGRWETAPSGCDEGTLTFMDSVEEPPCTYDAYETGERYTAAGGFKLMFGYSCMFYE